MIVFLEVEMTGQSLLLLVMELTGKQSGDQLQAISGMFSARSFCFRMRNSGVAALNLAHLMRVTLFPASHPTPMEAWPAERSQKSQFKETARVSPAFGHKPSTAHAAHGVFG
jgi:hypothetical protein